MVKIGINGFGRIGRLAFRIIQERILKGEDLEIVAINDPFINVEQAIYLLENDSIHPTINYNIVVENSHMFTIHNQSIHLFNERDPSKLNWGLKNAEYILECTGMFTTMEKASLHLQKGVKKIIISAPSTDVPMFVMGVNHTTYHGQTVVSNASCTTNCLSPLVKVIDEHYGIVEGLMTTVHSITSTQKTADSACSKNWRLGRNALNNIIPTSTGAAKAVTKIIPHLENKLTGMAFRVPTTNVSVVDLTVRLEKSTTYIELIDTLKTASNQDLKGILGVTDKMVVSSDFIGNPLSSVVDIHAGIALNDRFFKIVSWYDNEWGYSNRLVDLLCYVAQW